MSYKYEIVIEYLSRETGELIARDVIHESDVRSLGSLLIETKDNPHTRHRRLRRVGCIPGHFCEYHNAAPLPHGQFVLLDTFKYETLLVFLFTGYRTPVDIRNISGPHAAFVQVYDLIKTKDLEIVITIREFP